MAMLNFVVEYKNDKLGRIAQLRREYTNNNLVYLNEDFRCDYEGKEVNFKVRSITYFKSKQEAENYVEFVNDLYKRQGDKIQECYNWRY